MAPSKPEDPRKGWDWWIELAYDDGTVYLVMRYTDGSHRIAGIQSDSLRALLLPAAEAAGRVIDNRPKDKEN
jgi:hypothetical protein